VLKVVEIWEPKRPGTLWATPGLLPDTFTFTISSEVTTLKVLNVCSNEDREVFPNRRLGICLLFRNWFTAGFYRAVKLHEVDGWCLVSEFVATLQLKVRDKPVLLSLFTIPLNEMKWNSLGETTLNGRKVTKYIRRKQK